MFKLAVIPSIDMVETGRNIDRLRRSAGLSVRELQEAVGVGSPQAIYKWLNGASIPSVDNLVVLAVIFHTDINGILAVRSAG